MFGANGASPLEIRWRMLGVHFRVLPTFWLLCVICYLLGGHVYKTAGEIALHFAVLAACLFVTFLVHDFGHVIVGRFFGGEGNVVIGFGSGGGGPDPIRKRWQRIVVLLAGPFASFLLAAIAVFNVIVLTQYIPPAAQAIYKEVIHQLIAWNVLLCVLNLLPVWPYDVGRITMETAQAISRRWGAVGAMVLSAVTSGVLAVHAYTFSIDKPLFPWLPVGDLFWAILFGMVCVSNLMQVPALLALGRRPHQPAVDWEPPSDGPHSYANNRGNERTFEQMD